MLQNISAAYNSGSLEQDKSIEMAAARKPSNDVEAEPFIQEEEEEKLHKGMGWKRAAFTMMAEIVGTGVLGLSHAAAKVGCVFPLIVKYSS